MGAALAVGVERLRARPLAQQADFAFIQYHNQPETSPLHDALAGMWSSIKAETRGRVDTQVLARNNNIEGSDPAALRALMAGEIQFFTVMGGILGTVVPATDVQQMPFVFRSASARMQGDGRSPGRLPAGGVGGERDRELPWRRLRQRHETDRRQEASNRASG